MNRKKEAISHNMKAALQKQVTRGLENGLDQILHPQKEPAQIPEDSKQKDLIPNAENNSSKNR